MTSRLRMAKLPPGRHRVQVVAVVLRLGHEVAEVDVFEKLRVLLARQLEVVGREPVAEAARAGVNLHEERSRLTAPLQLDEVVAAAEAAHLVAPALGPPLAAVGNPPVVVHGDAVALRVAAVERRPVLLDVILRAPAHEVLKLLVRQPPELLTLPPEPHVHPRHHRAVKLQPPLRRRRLRLHPRPRRHHPAADVVAHRPHGDRAVLRVGDEDAADGDAVAVVRVGRDDDHADAGEARGVDDLPVENLLGRFEELRREEEADAYVARVLRVEFVEALAVPARKVLPVVRVG